MFCTCWMSGTGRSFSSLDRKSSISICRALSYSGPKSVGKTSFQNRSHAQVKWWSHRRFRAASYINSVTHLEIPLLLLRVLQQQLHLIHKGGFWKLDLSETWLEWKHAQMFFQKHNKRRQTAGRHGIRRSEPVLSRWRWDSWSAPGACRRSLCLLPAWTDTTPEPPATTHGSGSGSTKLTELHLKVLPCQI